MEKLKSKLLADLRKIDGIEDRPSPVAGGTALFYFGREFAHFHNANELDLRLTKTVIQELSLKHPMDSVVHPNRSPNSAWIELRISTAADVKRAIELAKIAVKKL